MPMCRGELTLQALDHRAVLVTDVELGCAAEGTEKTEINGMNTCKSEGS